MIKTSVGRLSCLFFFFFFFQDPAPPSIFPVRSHSRPQGKDSFEEKKKKIHTVTNPLFPSGWRQRALSPVSISYHLRGLAEHKGRSYRQVVFSSGSCLYSVLSVRKGSVLADGAVTSLVWKSRVYTMTWPDCFSMARLPFFFLQKKNGSFFLAEKKGTKAYVTAVRIAIFFFFGPGTPVGTFPRSAGFIFRVHLVIGRWLDEPSVNHTHSKWTRVCFLLPVEQAQGFPSVRGTTEESQHCCVASQDALRCLNKLSPKPVGSKHLFSPRKSFNAVLCSSFNGK